MMKIATWNVNGIRAREAQLVEWINRDQPDVICLQELKAQTIQIPESCRHPDYWCYWHTLRAYSGVSLQIRKPLAAQEPVFSHPDFDMESRIVQCDLGGLVVASVYVPNGGKDFPAKLAFFGKLIEWTHRLKNEGKELVLCGDLNIARSDLDVHPKERKAQAIGQLPEERALFEALLGDYLVDVTRALAPEDPNIFSWWAPWRNLRQRNIGWRIDYVLASQGIASKAGSCKVLAEVGTSDHAPVMLTTES